MKTKSLRSYKCGNRNKIIFTFLLLLALCTVSSAWIYPEHRDITLLAVEKLSPEYRSILDTLWTNARSGYEARLTEAVIDASQNLKPSQLDFASWPAISGDHSCSPENLLNNVLDTDWILKVADIAAQLKIAFAKSDNRHDHVNALRDSDIRLQRVDPDYATRAGSNNVHFLLARPNADISVRDYLVFSLTKGAALNALGAYAWFHISALLKASKHCNENLPAEERSALILSALADEAFGLHFLEDAFASGHTAGTWGVASQRKGTHDFYNEKGLEITTWDGKRMILCGDAFMRAEDVERSSIPVKISLEQFLDAATGKSVLDYHYGDEPVEAAPDSFNVCRNNYMPKRKVDPGIIDLCVKILVTTPIPGLAAGLAELPRFRAELGMFIGAVADMRGNAVSYGFGTNQKTLGASGGLDTGIRLGLGLEGVLHGGGDGLVFIDFCWRQDGATSMKFGNSPVLEEGGQITAAIPARTAYSFRIRMPFWLLPFDLIIASPLLLVDAGLYAKMAVTAGLGGVIPWQAGIETGIGRFQFILGREVGLSLYGKGRTDDALLLTIDDGRTALLNFRSTMLDLPLLEYRPFRTFSMDQSSSVVFQLSFGVDFPYHEYVVIPEGVTPPDLRPVYYLGLRTAFDWRYYF